MASMKNLSYAEDEAEKQAEMMRKRCSMILFVALCIGCDDGVESDAAPMTDSAVANGDMMPATMFDGGATVDARPANDMDLPERSDAAGAPSDATPVEGDAEPDEDTGSPVLDMGTVTDARPPVDPIEALFAPPTDEELEQVRRTWEQWDVGVHEWSVIGEGDSRGFRVAIVSHRVEEHTHYGAVRYPADYDPANRYPVLVLNHGGNNGVGVGAFGAYSRDCYRNFFIVSASYRGEELRTDNLGLGNLLSGGESSVIDKDVNDVIALLNGVLANMSGADETRIVAFGGSRGAGVTGLLSVRDGRIARAGVLYGATDHMHPEVQSAVQRAIDTGRGAGNPVNRTALTNVEAYLSGARTLAQAREALIRSSVVYFADDLPTPYHHHHGTADRSVPISQGRALASRMEELGIGPPRFEYTEYEGGEHSPNTMPGSLDAIRALLCGIVD